MTRKDAEPIQTIHRLLFRALLEMRSQRHEQQNKVVFHLADLFHTVVLEMERAARGECTYDDVMRSVHQMANEKGLCKWLDHNLAQVASTPSATAP